MSQGVETTLLCPNTGENCIYFHYCAARKEESEEGGVNLNNEQRQILKQMPPEVESAMTDEWCSDKRLLALSALAVNGEFEGRTHRLAVSLAEGIAMGRSHFISC